MSFSKESVCLNCSIETKGNYCSNCGQKTNISLNRSLKNLLGKLIINLSFLDSRTFISIRYLLFKPGRMTIELLEGKRKKFLNPISLFLFVNVIFFLFSPMKDYYLDLSDQISRQPHSDFALKLVKERLSSENLKYADYANEYNEATPKLSKLFMILNIPLIALFLYAFTFKRRKFFYDSLILACHYFSFFLLLVISFNLIEVIFPDETPDFITNTLRIITLITMLIYSYFTTKKVYGFVTGINIFISLYLFICIFLAQGLYRTIIFFITFWAT